MSVIYFPIIFYLSFNRIYVPCCNCVNITETLILILIQNEYLMHAILAISASHLALLQGSPIDELSPVALHHRILAIQGSNLALSSPTRTGSDADALLGASFLLLFQSSYMKDGVSEFFQFVRGCHLLDAELRKEKLPMAFLLHGSGHHFEIMKSRLTDLPVVDGGVLEGCETALTQLKACFERPVHRKYGVMLLECVKAARRSSLEGRAYFLFSSP